MKRNPEHYDWAKHMVDTVRGANTQLEDVFEEFTINDRAEQSRAEQSRAGQDRFHFRLSLWLY